MKDEGAFYVTLGTHQKRHLNTIKQLNAHYPYMQNKYVQKVTC